LKVSNCTHTLEATLENEAQLTSVFYIYTRIYVIAGTVECNYSNFYELQANNIDQVTIMVIIFIFITFLQEVVSDIIITKHLL